MAIIRFGERPDFWNPWSEFERIRQGLDKLSQGYMAREIPFGRATVFPALNVVEQRDNLIIKAELPGVKAEDLEVSLEGDTLSIRGKRAVRTGEEKISYHRREIETGNFNRSITLPIKVNPETVQARLINGVLTVTMDKAAELKPRQVTVKTE